MCGGTAGRDTVFPIGEEGVLAGVEVQENDPGERHLHVRTEHLGRVFSGEVFFDDQKVLPRVLTILESNVGRPIAEISALDVEL